MRLWVLGAMAIVLVACGKDDAATRDTTGVVPAGRAVLRDSPGELNRVGDVAAALASEVRYLVDAALEWISPTS